MSAAGSFRTTEQRSDKWECEICGKVFDSLYILYYHKLLEHELNTPPIGFA